MEEVGWDLMSQGGALTGPGAAAARASTARMA